MTDVSGRPRADLLISGATEVLTCVPAAEDPAGRRAGVVVAVGGEQILAVGPLEEVEIRVDVTNARILDATGKIVAPGFVDSHTHLAFGGSRAREYAARLTMSAHEVQALGIPTGILASVQMTRLTDTSELVKLGLQRVARMLRHGTTTVESKTGYGLTPQDEHKLLKVNRQLAIQARADVVSTYLGAHDFPLEMSREAYVDSLVDEMIPAAGESGLAEFCDVYCDDGYYTVEQSRRILEAGREAGLQPKIHTDAYSDIGGAVMAAELGVISADHLNYTPRPALRKLAEAGVVGVVMPALDFCVAHGHPFDARMMLNEGLTLALATDFCPACWVESMQFVMALACRLYRFTPAEALYAATVGGALALGKGDRGAIEAGKLADLQIWDLPSFEDVIYRIGGNAVEAVVKRGNVIRFDESGPGT
jgi:imidazolonepropionase